VVDFDLADPIEVELIAAIKRRENLRAFPADVPELVFQNCFLRADVVPDVKLTSEYE